MNKPFNLSVMIPCRDRPYMTLKTIESIHATSTLFNIDIYIFDNESHLDSNRFNIFQNLLEKKIIKYYSYDTVISTNDCFSKAVAFKRWISMMEEKIGINIKCKAQNDKDEFFALVDNDMLFGPGWDQYFISATRQIESWEKDIHFMVKYPGGIPKAGRLREKTYNGINVFNKNEPFEIKTTNAGGSSGFWFMNYNMLSKCKWNIDTLTKTYKRRKRHDSETWMMIKRKVGLSHYVAGVCPISMIENPLVIHLGGLVGSICNQLNNNNYTEKAYRECLDTEKKLIEPYSHGELFNKYKGKYYIW